MAILTGTGGTNHGTATSLDNLQNGVTYLTWVRPGTTLSSCGLIAKGTSAGANRITMEIRTSVVSNGLYVNIDRATTDASAEANVVVPGRLQAFATTFDGTNGPRLYIGNVDKEICEVETYSSSPGAGSGGFGDNNANNQWVGSFGSGTSGFPNGPIYFAAIWNRPLTLDELRRATREALWYPPTVKQGLVLWTRYNRPGTQMDWSGQGNHGTLGSTTVLVPEADRLPTPRRRTISGLDILYSNSISIIGTPTSTQSTGTSISRTLTLTAGSLVVVGGCVNSGTETLTCSDGVNTYTTAVGPQTQGSNRTYVWYAENVAAGSTTITVTTSAGPSVLSMGVVEVGGIATTSSRDTGAQTSSTGTAATSINISTTGATLAQANNIVIGVLGTGGASGGVDPVGGGGGNAFTEAIEETRLEMAYRITTTNAQVTWNPTWVTSQSHMESLTVYKEAGGAPPSTNWSRFLLMGIS